VPLRDTSHISGYPKFPFGNPAGFPRKTSDYPRALSEILFALNFNFYIALFGNFLKKKKTQAECSHLGQPVFYRVEIVGQAFTSP
jgi:hypothetical protein